jgi:TolB-like protein/DNA-binding winged helix-turn-helix (wHTH) protein
MPLNPRSDQVTRPETYIVADLRVDVGRQCVSRGDVDIALPNLSFRLLVALIQEAPNVVSNDRLMELVWPGQVVSPETVNKRATLLREALGDNAKEPRYVSGVRSRGYRLVAEVTRAERLASPLEARAPNTVSAPPRIESSGRDTAASETQNIPTKRTPKLWLGFSLFLVVVLAVGLVARTILRGHRSGVPVSTQNQQPVNAPFETHAHTVAVLPFEHMSADAADAYLARGVPEMILNRLSRVTGLAVIARSSSFALTTTGIDSQEIGRRLDSGYLVNGSVQRKADRLRVAVQLVDTTAGTLIWSASFDRALNDIFTVEDEIADQVASALSSRLGGLAPGRDTHQRSGNIEAYLAYLRGRTLLGRFTVAESDAAVPYLEKAIALDPNFSAAYASLYDARLQAAKQRHEDLAPVRQRFRPLIDRALAIDPNSGSAYFARAMWGDASLEARKADFLRGVALDPSNGRGLTAYAEFLSWQMERPQEGAPILQRALQIDPMSPEAHFHAAMMSLYEGGAAVEEQNMLHVLELDPQFVPALQKVGVYRWLFHDKLAEAAQILEHAIALDSGNPELRHTAMAVYLDLGDEQAARAVAAGTPQSARSITLLSIYKGDWRAAARAAFEDVRWDDACQNWLEAEALRDYALKTGELRPAIAFINANFYFENDPAAHLEVCNYNAAIVLSQLLAAQGHTSEAQQLRRATVSTIDANTAKYAGGLRRIRAGALLMDGRRDAALHALAEDFRSGDYRFWWYTLKFDPLWLPLHGDSSFQAIVSDVQRHIDAERNQLEELRRHGDVPDAHRPNDPSRKPRTE